MAREDVQTRRLCPQQTTPPLATLLVCFVKCLYKRFISLHNTYTYMYVISNYDFFLKNFEGEIASLSNGGRSLLKKFPAALLLSAESGGLQETRLTQATTNPAPSLPHPPFLPLVL